MKSKYKIHSNVFQAVLLVLFLYSAVNKTMGFEEFVNNLDQSLFFGSINTKFIACCVIGVEYLIPAMLFFKSTVTLGYLASFFLLAVFTGYICLMFMYSPYLPCSCGGIIAALSWKQHIFFNLFFMIITGFLIVVNDNPTKTEFAE